MALEQKLSLKLAQKLVMTPSLQQAIKMLQLTRLDLETYLAQELVENPVLEDHRVTDEEPEDSQSADSPEVEKAPKEESPDALADIDVEAYFNDYYEGSGPTASYMVETGEAPPLENTLANEQDLYAHLTWQLHMSTSDPLIAEIGENVIGNLSPDGFLVASIEELCEMGLDRDDPSEVYIEGSVIEALALVQSFDPPGIACQNLRESILHQLQFADQTTDTLVGKVVEFHWTPFLKRQFHAIAKDLEVELVDLKPVVERIKQLETRPGRKYSSEHTQYVTPDVHVKKVEGEYIIQLNDDGMPKLRVSRAYRKMLQDLKGRGDDEAYLKEKMRAALWLIKSLDQRQRTIYKVTESIIKQQESFLDRGIEHLRPMVLRDVAEDIGMHESTVSRVVSNKYMNTPRGLVPMKFFFHSGIDRAFGGEISSLSVKRKIKHFVESEDPKKPLSDSALTRVLKREGINIARRTVAKYRDELSIPSSTDRKKIF